MAETSDPLALDRRGGLPLEHLWLRESLPRDRWVDLHETAAFWMQMHEGFRRHQAHMEALVSEWRAGGDLHELHRRLTPMLQSFLQHLDGHHRIESEHYFPVMRRLEPRIGAGLDLLDRDHDAIHQRLEALFSGGVALHRAVSSRAPDAADHAARLADELEVSGPLLARHLEDEEDIVIPLIQTRGLVG